MKPLTFTATLTALKPEQGFGGGVLLHIPPPVSEALPSRGMVMVSGTLNNLPFQIPLEPDGAKSHWCRLNEAILQLARVNAGDTVSVTIQPIKEWPEPNVPEDIKAILKTDPEAEAIWNNSTPMARWDWVRWAGAAKQTETRQRRVESIPSRLRAGKRRPCCFDRAQCTLTEA